MAREHCDSDDRCFCPSPPPPFAPSSKWFPPSPWVLMTLPPSLCDSDALFHAGNYQTDTTSQLEWWFVVDPEGEHHLERLGHEEWPRCAHHNLDPLVTNAELIHAAPSHVPPHTCCCPRVMRPAHTPRFPPCVSDGKLLDHAEEDMRSRARLPLPPAHFEPARRRLNERLAQLKEAELCEEEQHGARLYTGPLFIKYNAVLRGISGKVPFLTQVLLPPSSPSYASSPPPSAHAPCS